MIKSDRQAQMNQAVSDRFFRFSTAFAESECPDSFVPPNDHNQRVTASGLQLNNPARAAIPVHFMVLLRCGLCEVPVSIGQDSTAQTS